MTDTVKRGLLSLGAAFLLCGALHVLLYKVDFFEGFVQFLCGAIAAVWGVSIGGRVTDRRLRRLLRAIALVLALYMVLQTVRFSFLPDGLTQRFTHYVEPTYAFPAISHATVAISAIPMTAGTKIPATLSAVLARKDRPSSPTCGSMMRAAVATTANCPFGRWVRS